MRCLVWEVISTNSSEPKSCSLWAGLIFMVKMVSMYSSETLVTFPYWGRQMNADKFDIFFNMLLHWHVVVCIYILILRHFEELSVITEWSVRGISLTIICSTEEMCPSSGRNMRRRRRKEITLLNILLTHWTAFESKRNVTQLAKFFLISYQEFAIHLSYNYQK